MCIGEALFAMHEPAGIQEMHRRCRVCTQVLSVYGATLERLQFFSLCHEHMAGLTPAHRGMHMDTQLLLKLTHLLPDLDEGLLHLHGIEAVQRVGHAQTGLVAAVLAGHCAQPVHAPGLVPEGRSGLVTI